MKSGIVRLMDSLGRIVIPKEICRTLKIGEGTPIEIYLNDQRRIILDPCKLQCVCCGSREENTLKEVNGVHLCPACIRKFGGAE